MLRLVSTLLFLTLALPAFGEDYLLRRVVAFPVEAPEGLSVAADQTWWKMREALTQNKKFLIASKQFLVRKDVFQPRSELSISDAVLLGKLLDSHALITTSVRQKNVTLSVYSGQTGVLLFTTTTAMNASVPAAQQLENIVLRLTRDFIASIPYQGFQIIDPLVGKAVFEEAGRPMAKIDIGANSGIAAGDTVQWIQLGGAAPLFQEGGQITVIGDGEILKVEGEIATVEIKRVTDEKLLKERALLRIPQEAKRIEEALLSKGSGNKRAPELVVAELVTSNPESAKSRPLLSALSSIASIASLILLGF